MMRLALVAAAATLAGAHDAAAAVANAHDAAGEVSWAEAQCMLRKRRIAFLGDSNSRFHWMTFNWFLETGKLRVPRGSVVPDESPDGRALDPLRRALRPPAARESKLVQAARRRPVAN